MTNALCFNCGAPKPDFVSMCGACNARPLSRDQLSLSLIYSSHLSDATVLAGYARAFTEGSPPKYELGHYEQRTGVAS